MAFYATAVVNLSKQMAGCVKSEGCSNTIYGIQAESILIFIATLSGLCATILMPFLGSVVDYTPYRRGVAMWTALTLIVFSALKTTLSEKTLLFCLIIMALTPLVMQSHIVAITAYFRELTSDEKTLGKYMGLFVALRSSASLFLLLLVLGLAVLLGIKPQEGNISFAVSLAKISQVIDVLLSSIFFIPTFLHRGFKPRPAQSRPTNTSLVKHAFISLYHTCKKISICENPALKWFLLSCILIGSAQSAVSVIALSYMLNFLHMSSIQVNISVFLFNAFKIVGAIGFRVFCKRNSCILRAFKLVIFFYSATLPIASIVIKGPQHNYLMYIFIVIWSICLGWILPNIRTIYIKLIPAEQQAQYMGIYLFFSDGFAWIPSLLTTLLVTTFHLSWSIVLGTFSIYTWLSLITMHFMGDYNTAKEYAKSITSNNKNTSQSSISIDKFEQDDVDKTSMIEVAVDSPTNTNNDDSTINEENEHI